MPSHRHEPHWSHPTRQEVTCVHDLVRLLQSCPWVPQPLVLVVMVRQSCRSRMSLLSSSSSSSSFVAWDYGDGGSCCVGMACSRVPWITGRISLHGIFRTVVSSYVQWWDGRPGSNVNDHDNDGDSSGSVVGRTCAPFSNPSMSPSRRCRPPFHDMGLVFVVVIVVVDDNAATGSSRRHRRR